jgi:oligopeptidase B
VKNDKATAVLGAISAFAPKNMLATGLKETERSLYIAAAGEAIGKALVSDTALEALRVKALSAPMAESHNKVLSHHGEDRKDPYYWIRDDSRTDKKVLSYLSQENEYRKAVMADTEDLQEVLYKELRGHIQEADEAVPVRLGSYHYYWRLEEGANYKIHCRRKVGASVHDENETMDLAQPEEILLDENLRHADGKKAGRDFYALGSLEVSPDHRLMAWSEDTVGRERFTIRVKDLETGKEMMAPVNDTSGEIEWYNDNATFLFVTKDDLDRPFKVGSQAWRQAFYLPLHALSTR